MLTALENAEFTLLLQGVPARARRERVLRLFREIGLEGMEHRRPLKLSGGQQQRVCGGARCASGSRRWFWPTSPPRIWTPQPPRPSST